MDCDAFFMDPQRTIDSVIAMYSFLMESTRGKIGQTGLMGGSLIGGIFPWSTLHLSVKFGELPQ